MSEQHPDPSQGPENSGGQTPQEAPGTSTLQTPSGQGMQPPPPDAEQSPTASAAAEQPGRVDRPAAGGRRVTRRTVDRSEVTEHTVETITEEIPAEYYQGPASTHPAPVG